MRHYKYWIALEQTKGIGPVHLREIYQALASLNLSVMDLFDLAPEDIEAELSLNPATARAIGEASKTLSIIENDYYTMLEHGVSVLMFFEDMYPSRLQTVLKNEYPPILYTLGNREILTIKGAAVLGEIGVSHKGELISYLAAKELCEHRISVISGFARGADMIAHRSALENGGQTAAVLPCGMGNLKIPETMKEVFNPDDILILSPYFFSREFTPYTALQRNRIVCALSYAVLIVEAPREGGIFEAGKSAKNLGIPLYAVEYSQYPDSALGNPVLIGEMGATPVRGRMTNDILAPNLDRLIGDVKFA